MNYLSHYYYNHRICGLPREPFFVAGVMLPDLWSRFSRSRRIRWRAVRRAEPENAAGQALRAGLINHVEVDSRFHTMPTFLGWQRTLRNDTPLEDTHTAVAYFLAHICIELTMDQMLLELEPRLADEFYARLERLDFASVETEAGEIGDVDARGLREVLAGFVDRHYLPHYVEQAALFHVVHHILSLTTIESVPPARMIYGMLDGARRIVDLDAIWTELNGVGAPGAGAEIPVSGVERSNPRERA